MIISVLGAIASQGGIVNPPYYTESVENVAWVEGFASGTGSLAKETDHLLIKSRYVTVAGQRTYVTDIAVDLTNIKTLYIDWSAEGAPNGFARLCASTNKNVASHIYDAQLSISSNLARAVRTLDVSTLTGSYFIRIHSLKLSAEAEFIVKVYKVWGEV